VLPASSAIIGANIEFTQEMIDSALKKMIPLFAFSKYTLGATNSGLNPNIMGMAENIQTYSNIKTACDYLNLGREPHKSVYPTLTFLDKCHEVAINGKMFATQSFTMKVMGIILVTQTHYAKLAKKDYILKFSLTYFDRASKIQLDKVMKSLKLS
jgi:hypothetical protein